MSSYRTLIVGGGISGLALAGARASAGDDTVVAEAQPEWQVSSSGITLQPPAIRALDRLGLLDQVEERGSAHTEIHQHNGAGERIAVTELPALAGDDKPRVAGILRRDLHDILLGRAVAAGATFRMGTTVTGVDSNKNGALVTFSDGSQESYDVVVGADGINSRMRDLVTDPSAGRPEFAGGAVWRALVPRHPAVETHSLFFGKNSAGANPVSDDEMYIFLLADMPEPRFVEEEERLPEMLELLSGFTNTMADIRGQITDPGQILVRPIYASLTTPPWHTGRLVLIGDAVHAPPPVLASGGGMAMEDAFVLSEELDKGADLETVFAAYTDRRWPRTRDAVERTLDFLRALQSGIKGPEAARLEQAGHDALAGSL